MKLTPDLRTRLIALCGVASREPSQPLLCCVQFTAERAYATDTYKAAWVDLPDYGPDEERLVPAGALDAVLKIGVWADTGRLTFGQEGIRVAVGPQPAVAITVEYWEPTTETPGDWTYPDIARLVPDELEPAAIGEGIAMRGDWVSRVAKVAGDTYRRSGEYAAPFRLLREPETHRKAPFAVEVAGEVVGLVMPAVDTPWRECREDAP